MFVRDVLAVRRADRRAATVGDKETDAFDRCGGALDELLNDKDAKRLVIEGHGIAGCRRAAGGGESRRYGLARRAAADHDGLRRTVERVALGGLDFAGDQRHSRRESGQHDAARFVGDVFAVGAADRSAGGVGHKEGHAGNRGCRAIRVLLNDGALLRRIRKHDSLRVVRVDLDCLRFSVKNIALRGLGFRDNVGVRLHVQQADFTVFVGDIDALCGGLPLVIVHEIAGDRGDAELGTRKRRAGRAVLLLDNQGTLFLVEKGECLRRAALDEDALGGAVQHKAADRLCFPRRDRCAGDKPGDGNAPVFVGDVVAACLPDHRAGTVRHMEHDARNRRGRARDILLQGKRLHRVVEEGQRLSVIGLDNDGLCAGALVDGIARDGLGFRDHQRTRDAGDRDSAVGVGGIKPVGGQLAVLGIHHAPIRVCHLELDARQRRFRHGIELLNG